MQDDKKVLDALLKKIKQIEKEESMTSDKWVSLAYYLEETFGIKLPSKDW